VRHESLEALVHVPGGEPGDWLERLRRRDLKDTNLHRKARRKSGDPAEHWFVNLRPKCPLRHGVGSLALPFERAR
jgi:hypothetical protein